MKYLSMILLLVGAFGLTGCASTWTEARVGVDASIDPVNGVSIDGGRFVRRVVEGYERSQGPMLYYQNRYGGYVLVRKHDVVEVSPDRWHVRFYLVANCNPDIVKVLRDGVDYKVVHEGNWDLHFRNERTNYYRRYTMVVKAEDGRAWELPFHILSSGPYLPTR